MRDIKHIVIHCTATSQGATVASIQRHWREFMKWKSPGYHKIVTADGTVITLAKDEAICNGVAGHNKTSLHISYIGGVIGNKPFDNRTLEQQASLLRELRAWKAKYPNAVIQGHRDFPGVTKACPSFDAKEEYAHL
jgi:N-acetylmuramoyl-L-alanine amidase